MKYERNLKPDLWAPVFHAILHVRIISKTIRDTCEGSHAFRRLDIAIFKRRGVSPVAAAAYLRIGLFRRVDYKLMGPEI